jgi:hypothetical protein
MNESRKKVPWSEEEFDRIFDEAVERAFRSRENSSYGRSRLFDPEIAEELRKILDQPRVRYTRYEEDDLSWLDRVPHHAK